MGGIKAGQKVGYNSHQHRPLCSLVGKIRGRSKKEIMKVREHSEGGRPDPFHVNREFENRRSQNKKLPISLSLVLPFDTPVGPLVFINIARYL